MWLGKVMIWLLALWPIIGVLLWYKVLSEGSLSDRNALLVLPIFISAGPFILFILIYSRMLRL